MSEVDDQSNIHISSHIVIREKTTDKILLSKNTGAPIKSPAIKKEKIGDE